MKEKKLKLITEILAVLVICLVSFVGVYKQKANKMENQVRGFEFTKDLSGYRELVFEVSDATEVTNSDGKVIGNTDEYTDSVIESNSYVKTENKINVSDNLTLENYKKAKAIIEERLKGFGVYDYNISLDEENGKIYLQIPENSSTDHTISNLLQVAKFEIKDSEDTSKVFISNENLKDAKVVYGTTTSGTTVYLQLELDKEGRKTLKEISSGEYATKEEADESESTETESKSEDENAVEGELDASTSENTTEGESETSTEEENKSDSETEEKTTQKKITLSIDSNDMVTSSFETPIEDGLIDLSMAGASKDSQAISDTMQSASTISLVLNSGKMPITYKIAQNQYIKTDITSNYIRKTIYIVSAITAIAILFLIIKFKLKGLIATIAYLGSIAVNLLVVRYTNVYISLESIIATIIIIVINYLIIYHLINIDESDAELRKLALTENIKSTIFKLIPLTIISIIFSFMKLTNIATFGMIMFWGIIISLIYNYVITKDMLE